MVREVAKWAATISTELQEAAKTFAENAGPVVALIGGALETLNSLKNYQSLSGMNDAIVNIAYWINEMVREVQWFAARMAVEIQESAKQFAENAGPVVDLIGGAIEVLNALKNYQSLSGLNDAIVNIAYWINEMVREVQWFAARMAVEIQESAKQFAENAGPVVDLIGGAIEVLNGLKNYQSLSGLNDAIVNIAYWIGVIVTEVGKIAQTVTGELQTAAKTFAENAGPVFGIIKGAVEAMVVLGGEIVMPENLVGKMRALGAFIKVLIVEIGKVGTQVTGELQTAAKTFAENAGPVFGIIKGAVEAMVVLGGEIVMPENLVGKMRALGAFIKVLIVEIGKVGTQVTGELQTAAKTFAENAGPVFAFTKSAIELITVLEEAKKPNLARSKIS